MMHGLIHEEGLSAISPNSRDLARHLYTRMYEGPVVIVSSRPQVLLSALRKQWFKHARKVLLERAGTLERAKARELTDAIERMQNLKFTWQWPPDLQPSDVYIVTLEQLLTWPPECRTMYITSHIELEHLYMVTAFMPPDSLVVTCPIVTIS